MNYLNDVDYIEFRSKLGCSEEDFIKYINFKQYGIFKLGYSFIRNADIVKEKKLLKAIKENIIGKIFIDFYGKDDPDNVDIRIRQMCYTALSEYCTTRLEIYEHIVMKNRVSNLRDNCVSCSDVNMFIQGIYHTLYTHYKKLSYTHTS